MVCISALRVVFIGSEPMLNIKLTLTPIKQSSTRYSGSVPVYNMKVLLDFKLWNHCLLE